MRAYFGLLGIGLGVGILAAIAGAREPAGVSKQPAPELIASPPVPITSVIEHTERSINAAAPKVTSGRRKLLAKLVASVAEEVFATREHQEYWIALVGVESAYNSAARSPVGAVGLGQLMPAYAAEFGTYCGLEGIGKEHIADDYTNLMLSACYFRHLIDTNNGSIPLALVSYNAGLYSPSLRRVKAGGSPVEETSAYVTKIFIAVDRTRNQQQ